MAKRSRKRLPSAEVASSDPEINSDATLGPGASLDGTREAWKDRESTNAPVVGEEEPSPVYAQGYPELIDRLCCATRSRSDLASCTLYSYSAGSRLSPGSLCKTTKLVS